MIPSPLPPRALRHAFSLVELLVALSIISVLAYVLAPVIGKAVERSREARCASNLRQLHVAMLGYANDNQGIIIYNLPPNPPPHIWSDGLVPYLAMNRNTYGLSGERPTGVFACPASENLCNGGSRSDYGKNFAVNGDNPTRPALRLQSLSQPGETIFLVDSGTAGGQCSRDVASWMGPNWNLRFSHFGRANLLFFDGHVEGRALADIPLDASKAPWAPNP